MRDAQNIEQIAALGVDMIGFILYDRSPRYVGDQLYPTATARVGVFVNECYERIVDIATRHSLTHIQLHGNESIELCNRLKKSGLKTIKALSVAEPSDFERAEIYDGNVDLLLFDTKCKGYGGSGEQFDWSLLDNYNGSTPFLLSGGIDESSAEQILTITHPMMAGVDLNSRFEVEPALKDIDKLRTFIEKIR